MLNPDVIYDARFTGQTDELGRPLYNISLRRQKIAQDVPASSIHFDEMTSYSFDGSTHKIIGGCGISVRIDGVDLDANVIG